MNWQEELRRLDAELAAGTITRHEHRKQRDELLAAVSGGGITSPVAAPLGQAGVHPGPSGWQSANPGRSAGPPPNTPEPAAPRQPEPEPPRPDPKPAPPSAALLSSDRPTTAPSPADERPTDPMRYPSMSEAPTVITRPVLPSSLPGLTPPVSRVSPGSTQQSSLPVLEKTRRRGPTWLYLTVGVVVVLGMIIGATWLFSAPTTSTTGGNAAAPTTTVNPELVVESKLPDLPGTPNPNNSTMSVDKAVQLQIISAGDAAKVRASGGQEVVYRASSDTKDINSGYMLVAIPTASADDATKLVSGLRQTLTSAGFKPDPLGKTDAETAYTGSNSGGRVSALWYASGSVAIGMGVSEPLNANPATLRSRLTQVRDSVVAVLPAS